MFQENKCDDAPPNAKPLPIWALVGMLIYGTGFFALMIVLPSMDWGWIEGWAYVALFIGITMTHYFKINKTNPAVIRNRMKVKKTGVTKVIKKEADTDKWFFAILTPAVLASWVLPGLDRQFGWSNVPIIMEIIGFVFVAIGVFILTMAQAQNAYASKLLDINEGQKLIDTGLYAHVRHPSIQGLHSGY
ncbi:hypothetical protein [Candidatus Lokiarchaeum ossiferum]|uniref:hypothetical protein n=1 Tax=Candidatus Lokiarchaeum ossiferum TaxID=2951803 RepID=UPI00352CDB3B